MEGLMRARYEKAGFLDADTPLSIADLLNLVGHLGTVEGVIASRWAPGRPPRFHDSPKRNMLSIGWSVLARAILLAKCRDTQCGAKFFRTQELKRILPRITVCGWAFDIVLLYRWEKAGLRCLEVPTTWKDQPGSKLALGRTIPLIFVSLLGLRLISSPIGTWTPAWVHQRLRVKLAGLAYGVHTPVSRTVSPTRSPLAHLAPPPLASPTRSYESP